MRSFTFFFKMFHSLGLNLQFGIGELENINDQNTCVCEYIFLFLIFFFFFLNGAKEFLFLNRSDFIHFYLCGSKFSCRFLLLPPPPPIDNKNQHIHSPFGIKYAHK